MSRRKKHPNIWFVVSLTFIVLVLIGVTIGYFVIEARKENKMNSSSTTSQSSSATVDTVPSSSASASSSAPAPYSAENPLAYLGEPGVPRVIPADLPLEDMWTQILNPAYTISEDLQLELEYIKDNGVDVRIYDTVKEMLAAAEADGVYLNVISGYRELTFQEKLFNNEVERQMNKGLSHEDAIAATARGIAYPGSSEHHLGLTLDITDASGTLYQEYDQTEEYRWMDEHMTDYGFILRYPKDKEDVTKIKYEPWHVRWVGVEMAEKIKASGLCMEDYLLQLYEG